VDRSCSTHGIAEKYIQNFGWKTQREETPQKTRHWWEDHIRMDLKEKGWEGLEWICLVQVMVQ
jgi:hypothetical protein